MAAIDDATRLFTSAAARVAGTSGRVLSGVDARLRPDLRPGWAGGDLPDQSGRTWAITGATQGIGLEAARAAAAKGARLVLLARRVEVAEQQLRDWGVQGTVVRCDLSDLEQVRQAAGLVDEPIDVLLDNAGTFATKLARTAQGHESMLATNFLGPFLLTNLLLGRVRDRVVITSSNAHRHGRFDAVDPDFHRRRFNAWTGYSQSKFCDSVWAIELGRRLEASGSQARVVVAHPGWASTNLQNNPAETRNARLMSSVDAVLRRLAQTAEAGSWPLLFAATEPLPPGEVAYVGPSGAGAMRGHPQWQDHHERATHAETAEAVWSFAVEATGSDVG